MSTALVPASTAMAPIAPPPPYTGEEGHKTNKFDKAFKDRIEAFACIVDAKACAQLKLLVPTDTHRTNYSQEVVHLHHQDNSFFYYNNTVVNNTVINDRSASHRSSNWGSRTFRSSSSSDDSDSDSDSTARAAICMCVFIWTVGALAIGGLSYALGAAKTRSKEAEAEIDYTKKFQDQLKVDAEGGYDEAVIQQAQDLAQIHSTIHGRLKKSADKDWYNRSCGIASAALTMIGAAYGLYRCANYHAPATSVRNWATPGLFFGAGTIGAMLYKAGTDSTRTQNHADYLRLNYGINKLQLTLQAKS